MKDIKMSLKMSFPGLTGESRRLDSRFRGNDKEKMQRAQASIEATLSLICLALLLMGGLRIYLWSAKHAVERQQEYEKERVKATESAGPFLVKGSDLPKLDVFAESGTKSDAKKD